MLTLFTMSFNDSIINKNLVPKVFWLQTYVKLHSSHLQAHASS